MKCPAVVQEIKSTGRDRNLFSHQVLLRQATQRHAHQHGEAKSRSHPSRKAGTEHKVCRGQAHALIYDLSTLFANSSTFSILLYAKRPAEAGLFSTGFAVRN